MPLRFRMEFVLNPQPPAATTIGQIKNWIQRCFNLEPEFIGLRIQGFDDELDNGDDLGFLDVDDNAEEITVTVNRNCNCNCNCKSQCTASFPSWEPSECCGVSKENP